MKDELIVKICKKVIVVFGILTTFNFIMLISGKSYALFTRTITTNDPVIHIETAKELPGVKANDLIKDTLGKSNGIIGVTNDNKMVTEDNGNVREWRYSGLDVNNYVYYNCNDMTKQDSSTCELWRIIGIFKDENGVEHLKIVKNEPLNEDILPLTYTINGTEYNIKSSEGVNRVYWNKKTSGENENNDWTTAGLQYYLNTESDDSKVNKGYLSYLKTDYKNMIEETTYYLGNVYYWDHIYAPGMGFIVFDSTISSYSHERSNSICDSTIVNDSYGNIYSESSSNNCSIWNGNKATWPGKIGLLYPSDVGFTTTESEWDIAFYDDYEIWDGEATHINMDTSWMSSINSYLISPSSQYTTYVASYSDGYFGGHGVDFSEYVSPTLYLKYETKIIDGEGSQDKPYQLSLK